MKVNYPPLDDRGFLAKYLLVVNTLLPKEQQLVDSEIELIIEFLLLDNNKFNYQRFGPLAKKKVIENAGQRGWKLTKININNKLYSLLEKGFLRRDTDKVVYMPKHVSTALEAFRADKEFVINIEFKYGTE
jgi:hypothetical protein